MEISKIDISLQLPYSELFDIRFVVIAFGKKLNICKEILLQISFHIYSTVCKVSVNAPKKKMYFWKCVEVLTLQKNSSIPKNILYKIIISVNLFFSPIWFISNIQLKYNELVWNIEICICSSKESDEKTNFAIYRFILNIHVFSFLSYQQ